MDIQVLGVPLCIVSATYQSVSTCSGQGETRELEFEFEFEHVHGRGGLSEADVGGPHDPEMDHGCNFRSDRCLVLFKNYSTCMVFLSKEFNLLPCMRIQPWIQSSREFIMNVSQFNGTYDDKSSRTKTTGEEI